MPEKSTEQIEARIEELEKAKYEKEKFLIRDNISLGSAKTNYSWVLGNPPDVTYSALAFDIESKNIEIDRLRQKVISLEIKSLLTSSRTIEKLTKKLNFLTIVLIISTVIIAGVAMASFLHL